MPKLLKKLRSKLPIMVSDFPVLSSSSTSSEPFESSSELVAEVNVDVVEGLVEAEDVVVLLLLSSVCELVCVVEVLVVVDEVVVEVVVVEGCSVVLTSTFVVAIRRLPLNMSKRPPNPHTNESLMPTFWSSRICCKRRRYFKTGAGLRLPET